MISPVTYYTAKCDNCKKDWKDTGAEYSAWNDRASMQDELDNAHWHQEGNKHYCPDCQYYDDDDNLKIRSL